ncbi:MAG TPA: hypothetical protein DCY74_07545 [Clostridiales bacterium]|jgi:hypothetical protein|nr:hypothetical protein [Clostridiales bacterium]HCG35375.1 hypothetical protein [Clostridiales bacterium]
MMETPVFNKHIFSLLLCLAKGQERSWRQYALDSDVSYVQMRKLANEQQENPPRAKLIQKLAQNAAGGITAADFLYAAGNRTKPESGDSIPLSTQKEGRLFLEKYLSLSKGQRAMVNEFIRFLSDRG